MSKPSWSPGALLQVVELLERLGVAYHLGGSVASSVHGVPRQTLDLDIVADLRLSMVQDFCAGLQDSFYVDDEMIQSAIRRRGSFNVVHLGSGLKVDLFIPDASAFDRSELARSGPHVLEGLDRPVAVKSPEDTVLRKLVWYRMGGEVSDRQWSDVLGVMRTQAGRMDFDYLRRWAEELEVGDLLEKAEGAVGSA